MCINLFVKSTFSMSTHLDKSSLLLGDKLVCNALDTKQKHIRLRLLAVVFSREELAVVEIISSKNCKLN